MTDKEKLDAIRAEVQNYIYAAHKAHTNITEGNFAHLLSFIDSLQEEPVSGELEEASKKYALNNTPWDDCKDEIQESFKAGAKWKSENLWKPADGDDLPEIDREVVVLIKYGAQHNIHDKEYSTYRVGFGHRPNPDGWNGTNIDTGEKEHFEPVIYDKGGWNQPHILYWLDARLPYEEK